MTTIEHGRSSGSPFRNVYIYFALLIPAALLGFAKTFLAGVSFSGKPLTVILNIHAALMVLWLLLLIAQALFIRTKRMRLHRWVGRTSYVIAPVIIVSVLVAEHELLNRIPEGISAEDARLEVFGIPQILTFAITWGLAILYRKRTPLHVRFMISTAFAIGTATVFRIILNWFDWVPGMDTLAGVAAASWTVLTLLLLALIVMDWRRGMKRSPFWVVTILIGIMYLGYWTYGKTEAWLAFIQWFSDL